MHPIFSRPGRLLWYAIIWLLVGGLIGALLVAADDVPWPNALLFAIPVCVLYGFVAMSAYYVCRALPMARRRPLRVAVSFGASALLSGALLTAICVAWAWVGQMLTATMGTDWSRFEITRRYQALLFGVGVGLYLLSIFAHDALIALENLHAAERREADSRMLARESELQALRAQINPHFLFNSLNSISALTAIDATAARDMTIALAQFFRQTLAVADQQKISLAKEIALCESFLTVEKIRFGKKLDTAVDVDDSALGALIPPMVLQPLLENAIKHGIRNLDGGGVIAMKITVQTAVQTVVQTVAPPAWLHISVTNPLDTDASPASEKGLGMGVGLQNIRLRLAALYDGRARIAWGRHDDHRFAVELTIPFETA